MHVIEDAASSHFNLNGKFNIPNFCLFASKHNETTWAYAGCRGDAIAPIAMGARVDLFSSAPPDSLSRG